MLPKVISNEKLSVHKEQQKAEVKPLVVLYCVHVQKTTIAQRRRNNGLRHV
ncbi:MAG: hypothetical protein AABZ31_10440 [Bdellovibrionota bacterium]